MERYGQLLVAVRAPAQYGHFRPRWYSFRGDYHPRHVARKGLGISLRVVHLGEYYPIYLLVWLLPPHIKNWPQNYLARNIFCECRWTPRSCGVSPLIPIGFWWRFRSYRQKECLVNLTCSFSLISLSAPLFFYTCNKYIAESPLPSVWTIW